jgi:hypothetical protein
MTRSSADRFHLAAAGRTHSHILTHDKALGHVDLAVFLQVHASHARQEEKKNKNNLQKPQPSFFASTSCSGFLHLHAVFGRRALSMTSSP